RGSSLRDAGAACSRPAWSRSVPFRRRRSDPRCSSAGRQVGPLDRQALEVPAKVILQYVLGQAIRVVRLLTGVPLGAAPVEGLLAAEVGAVEVQPGVELLVEPRELGIVAHEPGLTHTDLAEH